MVTKITELFFNDPSNRSEHRDHTEVYSVAAATMISMITEGFLLYAWLQRLLNFFSAILVIAVTIEITKIQDVKIMTVYSTILCQDKLTRVKSGSDPGSKLGSERGFELGSKL